MSSPIIADRGVDGGPRYQYRGHPLKVTRGHPLPLGASRSQDGVNFVLICRHATSVRLVLSEPCNPEIETEIPLGPQFFRTGDHWHVRILGLPDEFCYGYRVDGPKGPMHRYDPEQRPPRPRLQGPVLRPTLGPIRRLDPPEPPDPWSRRSDGRSQPSGPPEDTILYEMHVRGFTCDPSSGVRHPGTFAGLAEKLAYLKDLGITAVELLPIDEFDENDARSSTP